jgi:3-dehydroquinate synthase
MKNIIINSKAKDYRVRFEDNFMFMDKLGNMQCVVIVDEKVHGLYHKIINRSFKKSNIITIAATENNKTINKAVDIYKYMIEKSAKRNITIISIGGGIIQDITGFVSSTLYRGVNWIFIPTTLLSQTDSCIGSKTSLNFESYKNLIGTFYPPAEVYINVDFLQTLTELDFQSGIGEVVKLQLMKKRYPKNFQKIVRTVEKAKNDKQYLAKLIRENLKIKYSYFQHDEFDLGERNLLNYGHCFGHALETASNYYVPHGIAVIIGMIFANAISLKRGWIDDNVFNYLNDNLLIPNIPIKLKREHFRGGVLLKGMKTDKKRVGKDLSVILPDSEFRLIKIVDLSQTEFEKCLKFIIEILFTLGGCL